MTPTNKRWLPLKVCVTICAIMNVATVCLAGPSVSRIALFQSNMPSSRRHSSATRCTSTCSYTKSTQLLRQQALHTDQKEYEHTNSITRDTTKERYDNYLGYQIRHTHADMNIISNAGKWMLGFAMFTASMFLLPTISNADIDATSRSETSSATTTISANERQQPRRSRYWDMIESNDPSQISTANEKLLDNAVGTINTMYYDNSGGAKFSPKDMYDRWKVLRVYATEGIDGVKAINSMKQNTNDFSTVMKKGSGSSKQLDDDGKQPLSVNQFTFMPQQLFTVQGDSVKMIPLNRQYNTYDEEKLIVPSHAFDSRDNTVTSLKWLVSTLDDPYSKYLTREELQSELRVKDDGFLGLGLLVEAPQNIIRTEPFLDDSADSKLGSSTANSKGVLHKKVSESTTTTIAASKKTSIKATSTSSSSSILSITRVSNLPIVTAVVPDSPAERAGIVVGDRIAAIGADKFVGMGRDEIMKRMNHVYKGAENYAGYPDLTIAKPLVQVETKPKEGSGGYGDEIRFQDDSVTEERDQVVAYKLSRIRLPTLSIEPYKPYQPPSSSNEGETTLATNDGQKNPTVHTSFVSGGDAIVHYELLTPNDSIFRKTTSTVSTLSNLEYSKSNERVGYIRLTRFSRTSTAGYVKAVEELEKAGAQSFIIDVRNNYGGVIQESMLVASTLLRDPHSVLCYTMNSRGGFTPHDAEEYIVDKRYPGYLLSSESPSVTMEQVKRDDPEFVNEDGSYKWVPPSSYASLHEQRMKRGISTPSVNGFLPSPALALERMNPFGNTRGDSSEVLKKQLRAQKKVVILMNEGTASAAEVFVSSLHDNGRTVGLVGTKTYGKGLIQHTFPMSDGGGLRLTVAEYLTPALQHVTKVGESRYDKNTGELVGGGIRPDIYCPSTQGIPSNIGADICVGVALDALEDAEVRESLGDGVVLANSPNSDKKGYGVSRMGGSDDGSGTRRTITQGIVKDDF